MDSTGVWPEGGHIPSFEPTMNTAQNGEDWEYWLRWDPGAEAEATSPEDGTFNSGSSKNDSPLQDPVLPLDAGLYDTAVSHDFPAPPLVFGEDMLDLGAGLTLDNEPFVFGANTDAVPGYALDPVTTYQPIPFDIPKLDTNAPWNVPSYSAFPQDVSPSALASAYGQALTTAEPTPIATPGTRRNPQSSLQDRTSISSISDAVAEPPKKRGGRKRKADVQLRREEEMVQMVQEDNSGSQDGDNPPTKTSHNVIEKRYRNNLNDKIVELRNSVPSLRAMSRANGADDSEDLEGLTPAHKLNKATIMAKATEYIKHLEKRNKILSDEFAALQASVAAAGEAAVGRSKGRQPSLSSSPTGGKSRPRQPTAIPQGSSSAYLATPQDQTRYAQPVMQQQYANPQQQPVYARPANAPVEAQNQPQYVYGRGGGVMNKVMLGAMAGIMVMEGFSEQSQGDTEQLFATPTALFRRGLDAPLPSSPAAFARHAVLPLLKVACIIAALLYLIAPFFTLSPRRKPRTRPLLRLPQVPSLASPVEVRRKAWLTAVQTVYVPKHFLLEVAAVTAKVISLGLRRLVGSDTWTTLTGLSDEEEAARIKAWDIAIDAQLAGGDAEVSYHRLLLTLMASGTLPDSPTRLMQKAIHFRVFFWEVANAGYGNMVGFKQFTEQVGKIYWDSARKLQKDLVHAKAQGRPIENDEVDLLPDHLASLVELECDDVMSDEMIQRAWNLAWDKPSAYKTMANAARDSVVEDHAIRSLLDALAAWYANMTIDDTLLDTLGETPLNVEVYLTLAVSISPPASATQVRALAAKAVLSKTDREANITAALEALPPTSPSGAGTMNLVKYAPAAPDVRLALTMAKLLSLLSPSGPSLAHARAYDMIATLRFEPQCFTLLTATTTYHLLRTIDSDREDLPRATTFGLENMAASLRLWVGTSVASRKAIGLKHEDCSTIVDLCLGLAKRIGGWDERDSGYGGSAEGSPVRARAEMVMFA